MDIEDVMHVYNGILFSHKEEWNDAICSSIDGPKGYHIKWSMSDRKKTNIISDICVIYRKDTNEFIGKADIDSYI